MHENGNQQSADKTDVAVIGAGILGLMNALGLAKRGLKVTLIDNIVQQKRSYKVGESLLVFSNAFLRTIGDIDDYVKNSYPKDGVWFTYGMEGQESFAGTTEWAFQAKVPPTWRDNIRNPKFARSMFYDAQIVRPEAEDLLREHVRAMPNITFLDTAIVDSFQIADDDAAPHTLRWKCGVTKQEGTVEARWLIDCSGRRRLFAKSLGHAAEDRFMHDGFQTTAVWAQFDHIEDKLFGDAWRYEFKDGDEISREANGPAPTTFRDRCTLHLWGEGYWIWVIRLIADPKHPELGQRVSIGVSWDHKQKPPGRTTKEQFWNVINRYPTLTRALKPEHVLEFRQFAKCQHMTDTFVSEKRYGMVGDAASIIDAYYSQGVSLGFVTSWHIANIIEEEKRSGSLDREYIRHVNRSTIADWHMMRNTIVEKYTSAIKDPRFFILSHLLDFTMIGSITPSRWRLARWLAETGGYSAQETAYHKQAKQHLKKQLYYSQSLFPFGISPETAHKLQRTLQAGLAERARWRVENDVKLGEIKVIARAAAMLPNFFAMVGAKAGTVTDLTPGALHAPPSMLPTGQEDVPPMFKVAPRILLSMFLAMYGYDAAETYVRKALRGTKAKTKSATPAVRGNAAASSEASARPDVPWGDALQKGDPMPDVMISTERGDTRRLSDYWREQPTAFVFVRHLNCPHCRIELRELHRDRAQVERLGGRIVVVTMGTPEKASQFKAALRLDFPHIADPHEQAYEACGLLLAPNTASDNLKAIASETPFALKQMLTGEHGKLVRGGNGWRLGGTFVADQSGRLVYVFRNASFANQASFADVVGAFREIAGCGVAVPPSTSADVASVTEPQPAIG